MKSTTLSTTSERLNLNNPTQGTQCGVMNSTRFSVPKMKKSLWLFDNGVQLSGESNDNEKSWKKSVICFIRAFLFYVSSLLSNSGQMPRWEWCFCERTRYRLSLDSHFQRLLSAVDLFSCLQLRMYNRLS